MERLQVAGKTKTIPLNQLGNENVFLNIRSMTYMKTAILNVELVLIFVIAQWVGKEFDNTSNRHFFHILKVSEKTTNNNKSYINFSVSKNKDDNGERILIEVELQFYNEGNFNSVHGKLLPRNNVHSGTQI